MTKDNSKGAQGKTNFWRMNYLYQASELMAHKSINSTDPEFKKRAEFTSNHYCNLLMNIAKKTVQRIDPDIKRTICKRCQNLMIPGENTRVRFRNKPEKHVIWTCLKCYHSRIYNARKDHSIWSERPQAIKEILEFGGEPEIESIKKITQ